ncbi:MAG: hypothetical protein JXJ04_17180, partial [Spirochaetales bacterium]|nr:hypothetical protein [Spirochaetales bacterium]
KQLKKIAEEFKEGQESAIGIYLFKDLRIQISKYKASGAERFARLYRKRRENGLCVICAVKVADKNPRTGKLYRLCAEHRDKIDRKPSK